MYRGAPSLTFVSIPWSKWVYLVAALVVYPSLSIPFLLCSVMSPCCGAQVAASSAATSDSGGG